MKKRLLMLTLIGALGCTALTACGKADEPSPAKEKQEKETDGDAKEENKENKEEEPEDPDVDEPIEVDGEDYDAVFAPLLGEWVYADDDMDPMYLTVYSENGMYYYKLEDMTILGSSKGTVDLFSDDGELIVLEMENGEVSSKHSEYGDGSVNFYFDNGGIVWADHEDPSHQDMVFVNVSD